MIVKETAVEGLMIEEAFTERYVNKKCSGRIRSRRFD